MSEPKAQMPPVIRPVTEELEALAHLGITFDLTGDTMLQALSELSDDALEEAMHNVARILNSVDNRIKVLKQLHKVVCQTAKSNKLMKEMRDAAAMGCYFPDSYLTQ